MIGVKAPHLGFIEPRSVDRARAIYKGALSRANATGFWVWRPEKIRGNSARRLRKHSPSSCRRSDATPIIGPAAMSPIVSIAHSKSRATRKGVPAPVEGTMLRQGRPRRLVSKVRARRSASDHGHDWVKKLAPSARRLLDGNDWDGIYFSRRKDNDLNYTGKVTMGSIKGPWRTCQTV